MLELALLFLSGISPRLILPHSASVGDEENDREKANTITNNDESNSDDENKVAAKIEVPLPDAVPSAKRPVERVRTPYFIFADEIRPAIEKEVGATNNNITNRLIYLFLFHSFF